MDCSDIIACLDPQPFTVYRRDEGQRVRGRRIKETASEFQAIGSIQQADSNTMLMLPEGTAQSDVRVIYTSFCLRIASAKKGVLADVIVFDEDRYEVFAVDDWITQGGYVRAVCTRLGQ